MKINIDKKKKDLAAALKELMLADPSGKFLEILNGGKIPKTDAERTDEDRAKMAAAEQKRAVRATKRLAK